MSLTVWETTAEVSLSSWMGFRYVLRVSSVRLERPDLTSRGSWKWSVENDLGLPVARGAGFATAVAARKAAVKAMAADGTRRWTESNPESIRLLREGPRGRKSTGGAR